MAAIARVQTLEIIHKTCLEAEAEAAEEKFAYTAEKIKTQKIGNDTYQLREQEYKRLIHDLKNLVEEEVERKVRSEEETGLSMLIGIY